MTFVEDLVRLVEEVSGNTVPERELERLGRLAAERARTTGWRTPEQYVDHLRTVRTSPEWRHLLAEITVKESYLFRAPAQLASLAETVLPALAEARRATRRLRLWSAGCARGEEAATLAIVLATNADVADWDWRIVATDVDAGALEEARRGRYGSRAVSRVPEDLLEDHLPAAGDGFQLRDALRQRIDYRPLNLVARPFQAPKGAPFDVVFLRNVLIYFKADWQRYVIRGVAANLADDGYLFLGPSESLLGLSDELRPVELEGCFCYRHSCSTGPRPTSADLGPAAPGQASPGESPASQALCPSPTPTSALLAFEHVVRTVVASLCAGRPAEALDLLATAQEYRPEAAVLRALAGLAHDRSGAIERAVEAFRAALYLDAGLFQARLALADCLDRLGLAERAGRERQRALTTLAGRGARELPGAPGLGLPGPDEALASCSEAVRVTRAHSEGERNAKAQRRKEERGMRLETHMNSLFASLRSLPFFFFFVRRRGSRQRVWE